jgi:BCD family chlorophyll transporter-like MFS transporter
LFATAASDIAHALLGSTTIAYAAVFVLEAGLFVLAANLAVGVFDSDSGIRPRAGSGVGRVNLGMKL